MSFSIEYVPTRQEVWDVYWWSWRQPRGLWRYHVFIIALFSGLFVFTEFRAGTLEGSDYLLGAFYGLLASLWVSIIPQIMYSEERRKLSFDEWGVEIRRGGSAKRIPWRKVARIHTVDDQIIIMGKSGNAFVIPARAFESDAERDTFLTTLTGLHGESGG